MAENSRRIDEANCENEFWKIVNDITKPKSETTWKLDSEKGQITKVVEVAEELNEFFVSKIAKLKDSIDTSIIEDPLSKLKTKMENRNLNFALKNYCQTLPV